MSGFNATACFQWKKQTTHFEPWFVPFHPILVCRSELMAKDPKERLGHTGADEILAHPWFGDLDRDAMVMDQVESPYVPNKDINAAPQRSIGSFADTGSKV